MEPTLEEAAPVPSEIKETPFAGESLGEMCEKEITQHNDEEGKVEKAPASPVADEPLVEVNKESEEEQEEEESEEEEKTSTKEMEEAKKVENEGEEMKKVEKVKNYSETKKAEKQKNESKNKQEEGKSEEPKKCEEEKVEAKEVGDALAMQAVEDPVTLASADPSSLPPAASTAAKITIEADPPAPAVALDSSVLLRNAPTISTVPPLAPNHSKMPSAQLEAFEKKQKMDSMRRLSTESRFSANSSKPADSPEFLRKKKAMDESRKSYIEQ